MMFYLDMLATTYHQWFYSGCPPAGSSFLEYHTCVNAPHSMHYHVLQHVLPAHTVALCTVHHSEVDIHVQHPCQDCCDNRQ